LLTPHPKGESCLTPKATWRGRGGQATPLTLPFGGKGEGRRIIGGGVW